MFESVDARTHEHTDGRWLESHPISLFRAFGSGELKMTTLEWSQYFSHYKSMEIFPDTKGQLTHKSLVGSGRISNPFKMLWLFSLPARMIKVNKQCLLDTPRTVRVSEKTWQVIVRTRRP